MPILPTIVQAPCVKKEGRKGIVIGEVRRQQRVKGMEALLGDLVRVLYWCQCVCARVCGKGERWLVALAFAAQWATSPSKEWLREHHAAR